MVSQADSEHGSELHFGSYPAKHLRVRRGAGNVVFTTADLQEGDRTE